MADSKYFWLKLKEDFFRQKEIKKLRSVAGGDTYTIIYLKLQLISLKTDGIIEFTGLEDDFAKELALEIDESAENVNFVLMYLSKIGWLTDKDERLFSLPETIKNICSETAAAERMRKHRNVTKLQPCSDVLQICSTDIEIEIERELELELDKDFEKNFSVFSKPKSIKSKNSKSEQSFLNCSETLKNSDLSAEDIAKLGEWLQYKRERKDIYTTIGFSKLITEYKNNVKEYGRIAVFEVINQTISAGYIGIVWDKLKKLSYTKSTDNRKWYVDETDYDDEKLPF